MLNSGMHEAAGFAALHCGQPHALDPTAGFAPGASGQGGLCRIDGAIWTASRSMPSSPCRYWT